MLRNELCSLSAYIIHSISSLVHFSRSFCLFMCLTIVHNRNAWLECWKPQSWLTLTDCINYASCSSFFDQWLSNILGNYDVKQFYFPSAPHSSRNDTMPDGNYSLQSLNSDRIWLWLGGGRNKEDALNRESVNIRQKIFLLFSSVLCQNSHDCSH